LGCHYGKMLVFRHRLLIAIESIPEYKFDGWYIYSQGRIESWKMPWHYCTYSNFSDKITIGYRYHEGTFDSSSFDIIEGNVKIEDLKHVQVLAQAIEDFRTTAKISLVWLVVCHVHNESMTLRFSIRNKQYILIKNPSNPSKYQNKERLVWLNNEWLLIGPFRAK